MDNNSKISVDDLTELARAGVISWVDATKPKIEQLLGIELVDISSPRSYRPCYQILDPTTEGSDSIVLYVQFDRDDTGEPSGFCFKNDKGLSIPLSVHNQNELDGLEMMNQYSMYRIYLTAMSKLTREAYLSAVANRDMIYLPTQEQ